MNDKLIAFIERVAGVERSEIFGHSNLEDDLGITGDDAIDLILAYGKLFNVDVSNFMASDYFGDERNVFLSELFNWLFRKRRQRLKKSLTVSDLEKGILVGKLDDTVIRDP